MPCQGLFDIHNAMHRGYVRNMGLSANQLIHIPLAGDFQMSHISSHPQPAALGRQPGPNKKQQQPDSSAEAMDASGEGAAVLATADPEHQEPLIRENDANPLAGEQTWPTEQVCKSLFASSLEAGICLCWGVAASCIL